MIVKATRELARRTGMASCFRDYRYYGNNKVMDTTRKQKNLVPYHLLDEITQGKLQSSCLQPCLQDFAALCADTGHMESVLKVLVAVVVSLFHCFWSCPYHICKP